MAVQMRNYRLEWTDPHTSEKTVSASAYGRKSAEDRQRDMVEAGLSDAEIIEVKPGE